MPSHTSHIQNTPDIFFINSKALAQAFLCKNLMTICFAEIEVWPKM